MRSPAWTSQRSSPAAPPRRRHLDDAAALVRSPCDPAAVCGFLARSVEAGHLRLDERAAAALAALHARRPIS